MRKPYRSSRKARQDRLGLALIAATVLGFAGMLYGAAKIDHARGTSVEASLALHGIGRAAGNWQIIHLDKAGNAYVDDHGLSLRDCVELAAGRNQSAWGKFQCERSR